MRGGCGVKSPVVQGGVKVDKAIGNTNSPVRKSGYFILLFLFLFLFSF